MKKINIAIISLALVATLLFATLGRNTEISDYDIVSGIAIDKSVDKWIVTCELCVPSKDDLFGSSAKTVKGEGYTLENAFKNASENSEKIFYADSVRIYLVSSSLRQVDDVRNFFKNNDVNMRSVAIYTEGKASKLLSSKEGDGIKSTSLADKVKRYCFEIKKPVPKIASFIKNSSDVYLSANGTAQRSDYKVD